MPNQPRNKFGRQARMQRRNATSTPKQSPGVGRKVDASADRVDIVLPSVNVTAKGPKYKDVRAGRTTAAQQSKFRYRKAQEAKAAKAVKQPSATKPVVAPKPTPKSKLKTFTSSDFIGTEGMSASEIIKRGPQGEPTRRPNESMTAYRQRLAKYRRENK